MNLSPDDFPVKLASPARRALAAAGLHTLEQVSQMKKSALAKLHGMGPKAIQQLESALQNNMLSFEPETKPDPEP